MRLLARLGHVTTRHSQRERGPIAIVVVVGLCRGMIDRGICRRPGCLPCFFFLLIISLVTKVSKGSLTKNSSTSFHTSEQRLRLRERGTWGNVRCQLFGLIRQAPNRERGCC
ncbi:uncharacterized protein BO87DRAFT_168006 [Aspergillus neoniger CBS 115656]|uniref:Uncharacterized protein n=1 Tax=Aspergillus neoniger (strain CBS 115656) TaxID=1448310 RepID=A0A318YUJ2_ASPNB|nr:hypothetical protein BO87DRAFT_168006 [Aspergillus neoniger CBS 115656]PYH38441.1 hypothetical protein BO87DRAFT_168006 [Aspergillus neoniger CBS 115656]